MEQGHLSQFIKKPSLTHHMDRESIVLILFMTIYYSKIN